MTGIIDNSGARRQADQALAVPVEPVARLDPTGFDPSRFVSLNSASKLGRFLRRLELGWSPWPRMGFDEADEWDWRAFL
jgi:hypothetical protein